MKAKGTIQVLQQVFGICDLISYSLQLSGVGNILIYRESNWAYERKNSIILQLEEAGFLIEI